MRKQQRQSPEEARRAEESLRAIEAGGIPIAAQERLAELRKGGSGFFTSDLTTNEFLAVRQAGFRPVTQVMGSSVYNIGWQGMPYGYYSYGVVELDVQTEAWNEARRLALSRLRQEAELAGADAVLGVRLTRGHYDWAQGLIEFAAMGTAVTSEEYDLGAGVCLSSLSGQEFANLVRTGWMPIGIAAGSTVSYVVGDTWSPSGLGGLRWGNQEMAALSNGVSTARNAAMFRVRREANELEAAGIVGLRIDQHRHPREIDGQGYKRLDLILTMHLLGTAVVAIDADSEPPQTYTALALD